jgi:hypothetical protein
MRLVKKEYLVYSLDELDQDARKKAIEDYRQDSSESMSLDCETSEMKRLLEMFGFNDVKLYYSGFWSQGDGASFVGSYKHVAGGLKAVKEEFAGTWFKDVIYYLELLEAINKKCFYSLLYRIDSRGNYCHANTMQIDYISDYRGDRPFDKYEDELLEYVRGIGNTFYRMLEKAYDGYLSDESLIENIEANGYEFYENGERT